MRYEELFHPENVLFLTNITDKSQKYCQDKGVELSVENIEKARVWLFKKQLEVAE